LRRCFDTSSGRGQFLDLATVTVAQGTCASGATAANFTGTSADQPLTNLSVTATSVLAAASNSRISCTIGGTRVPVRPRLQTQAVTRSSPIRTR
jgi:hypothetical protein